MNPTIKIYCQTCREYVLDTTEEFIPGGPYHGAMFAAPEASRINMDTFAFQEWVTYGDLFCPRCENQFILGSPEGGEIILTEHGLLEPECGTVDRSMSIINPDMSLQRVDIWNGDKDKVAPDPSLRVGPKIDRRLETAAKSRQDVIDQMYPKGPDVTSASAIIAMGGALGETVETLTEEPPPVVEEQPAIVEEAPPVVEGSPAINEQTIIDEFPEEPALPPDKSLRNETGLTPCEECNMVKGHMPECPKHEAPAEASGLHCQFCGRDIKKKAGLTNHERACKNNPKNK